MEAFTPAFIFAAIVLGLPLYFRKKLHQHEIQMMATTLGIAFTFIGIVLALQQLDLSSANMASSLQKLLEGLYVAFLSSITGVAISLWTQIQPSFWKKDDSLVATEETDIDALILSEIKKLNANISSDSNTSLITRLEKFQLAVTEKQDQLKNSFDEFAKQMSGNIMQALEEVIREFNVKISEQFGENFKHLNDGVGKMLEWQQKYGEQVEMATKALIAADKSLSTSADALTKSTDNAASYIQLAEQMEKHIKILGKSLNEIEDISTSASKAFQEMQQTMDSLQTNIVESANEIITTNAEHVEKMSREMDANNQTFMRTANEANQKLHQTMLDSSKKLQDQVTKLDDQLGQELNKSLSTLGSQLTSLSGRFVEDYAQLAERLKIVIAQMGTK